jgi:hypothetical protein
MGLLGVLVLAVFLMNLAFTYLQARGDADLQNTVATLRAQARRHDAEFTQAIGVTIAEATRRLEELRLGLTFVFAYFASSVPEDFYRDDDQD